MNITELLTTPTHGDHLEPVEMDALTEVDKLIEAALLEVSLYAMSGDAWLLFDCRGAFQLPSGNVAVVVVRDVSELSWINGPRGVWTWHLVMSWEPQARPTGLAITAGLTPDADLRIVGSGDEFYVGNIPDGDAPPASSPVRATRRSGEVSPAGRATSTWSPPRHASSQPAAARRPGAPLSSARLRTRTRSRR